VARGNNHVLLYVENTCDRADSRQPVELLQGVVVRNVWGMLRLLLLDHIVLGQSPLSFFLLFSGQCLLTLEIGLQS